MQQARHEQPPVNVSELETMHRLVTAENFDENAVRAQAEKMANEQIARQVEMAKVLRNQMYRLLTPEQQAVLNEKHQQRMEQLRDVTQWQKSSSLKLLRRATHVPSSNAFFLFCHRHHPCSHMMWGFFYPQFACCLMHCR